MSIMKTTRETMRDERTGALHVAYSAESRVVTIIDAERLVSNDDDALALRQADERNARLLREDAMEVLGIAQGIERASEALAARLTAIFRATVTTEHRDGAIALAQDALGSFLRDVTEMGGNDG